MQPIDTDTDQQTLALSGSTLSIVRGNSINIPSSADNLGNHTATANIKLNNYWLSNDGDSEGVYVSTAGNV